MSRSPIQKLIALAKRPPQAQPDEELTLEPQVLTQLVLDEPDAEVIIHRGLLAKPLADRHLVELDAETPWRQDKITVFSKTVDVPRLASWHADVDKSYTYSGLKMEALAWTDELLEIKSAVETAADASFNSVLLNKYRDSFDGVGWHADDEPELGANPIIGSVSLGASRRFQLRRRYLAGEQPTPITSVDLHHGDVMVMSGATQHHWVHQVPKRPRGQTGDSEVRINLTFRRIV